MKRTFKGKLTPGQRRKLRYELDRASVRNSARYFLKDRLDHEAAIRVIAQINKQSAYGHNPELCKASNLLLKHLRQFEPEPLDVIE